MGDAPVAAGAMIAGKYRVDRQLGAGAMGVVLAATDVALDRKVAIKLIQANQQTGKEHLARFLREARAAARLKSEHVARVLDFGAREDGSPYLVMELLDGKDLAELLRARGPLPVEEAVTYVLQACEAVAEAHEAGIVHRDLKPSNLFLTRAADGSPSVKLVDFGVAKVSGSEASLTTSAHTLGSPLYMSPEAIRDSKTVDGRADVWALGVTLYELLAAHTPFRRDQLQAVVGAILYMPPDPLHELRPDLPGGLVTVIDRALQKDRDQRWPDVATFAAALAPYAPRWLASGAGRVVQTQHDVPPSRPADLLPPEPESTSVPAETAGQASTVRDAAAPLSPAPGKQSAPRPLVIAVIVVVPMSAAVVTLALWWSPATSAGPTTLPAATATVSPARVSATATTPAVVTLAPAAASATAAPVATAHPRSPGSASRPQKPPDSVSDPFGVGSRH